MDRWCWPFLTPNVAGVMYAALGIGLIVLFESVRARSTRGPIALTLLIVISLLSVSSMAILAATGSRAGWLALLIGLVISVCGGVVSRSVSVIGASALLMAAVALPVAQPRLLKNPSEDSSILMRFDLWRSSISLIEDYPMTGIERSMFKSTLNRWYLPPDLSGRFETTLNDGLMLGAIGGLPALGAVGAALGFLVGGVWACGRGTSRGGELRWPGLAILSIILVGGQFQAHLWSSEPIQLLFIASTTMTILGIVVGRVGIASRCIWPCIASGAVLPILMILLMAYCKTPLRPIHTTRIEKGLAIAPITGPEQRIAIIVVKTPEVLDFVAKHWADPLLKEGWTLRTYDQSELKYPLSQVDAAINSLPPSTPAMYLAWGEAAGEMLSMGKTLPLPMAAIDPEGEIPDSPNSLTAAQATIFATRYISFGDTAAWSTWIGPGKIERLRGLHARPSNAVPIISRWFEGIEK